MREALDHILQEFQTPDDQVKALEDIRSIHPHSIRPAEIEAFCELRDGNILEYDCFVFALDLIDCAERIAARKYAPRTSGPAKLPGIHDALPGANFLHFLQLSPQSSLESCRDCDLAVYSDRFGRVHHAGKIVEGKIVFKWGMKDALWQHGLWEVPSSYGTCVQFYSHRSKEYVRQRWLDYLSTLAQRLRGFISLVSVMCENKGKNLSPEELLGLAAKKGVCP